MEQQKGNLGRILIFLMLIVVLPALSYMYVKRGFEWRKQAVQELGVYGRIPGAYLVQDGKRYNLLEGKVTIAHFFGEDPDLTAANKKIIQDGQRVNAQFSASHNFRNAVIWWGGTPAFKEFWAAVPDHEAVPWVYDGAMGAWKTVLINQYEIFCKKEGIQPAKEYYALADTTGTIRRFYDALDDKQVERMVAQIAILLPKEQ